MFKVLSWNISWGAMSGTDNSKFDISAYYLAYNKCYKEAFSINKPNWCINNVINYLVNLDNYFHFIGLQEANKWQDIIYELNIKKNNSFEAINSKSGKAEIATFYRKDLYTMIKMISGNITDPKKLDRVSGRPYHIIIFQHNITKKYYIIINLHNAHGIDKELLESELSKNINDLSDELINRKFKVIAFGDFNDNNKYNYWKGLTPFINLNKNINNILKNTIISYPKKPPFTCCVGKTHLRKKIGDDKMFGDYVLINNRFKNIKLMTPYHKPKIKNGLEYNANINPTSDHLPIIAMINYKLISIRKII
jgi:hypothetical protein